MTDPSSGAVENLVSRRTGVLSLPMLIPLIVGLLVGAAATYSVTNGRGVPAVVQGTVSGVAAESADGQVKAIAFRFDGHDYTTPGEGEVSRWLPTFRGPTQRARTTAALVRPASLTASTVSGWS